MKCVCGNEMIDIGYFWCKKCNKEISYSEAKRQTK